MNLLTVYCDRDWCRYRLDSKCSTTGIQIDSDGYCTTYEKEEIPDIDRPDAERV